MDELKRVIYHSMLFSAGCHAVMLLLASVVSCQPCWIIKHRGATQQAGQGQGHTKRKCCSELYNDQDQ